MKSQIKNCHHCIFSTLCLFVALFSVQQKAFGCGAPKKPDAFALKSLENTSKANRTVNKTDEKWLEVQARMEKRKRK